MNKPYKTWVCHDCKFLSLAGDFGNCDNQARYSFAFMTGFTSLLPEAKATMALPDNETECSYKIQGDNGIFDDNN